jgi:hypothetical protein
MPPKSDLLRKELKTYGDKSSFGYLKWEDAQLLEESAESEGLSIN